MKKTILTIIALSAMAVSSQAAVLVAGWDFQTTTNGGTAAAANPGAPLVYTANFGAGTIYLDGTHGSSTFTSLASSPQVTGFGGSNVNTAGTSFSTTTSGVGSLAVANSSANGFAMVFAFDMTNFSSLQISYSTQASGTGFNSQDWSYSIDGGANYIELSTFNPRPAGSATTFASIGVVTLPTLTALDGVSNALVKLTINGATASAGNNRLDNIQFNAVPEPATTAMLLGGAGAMFWIIRRKRAIKG